MDEFDRVAPWIASALQEAGGTHSIEDIRQAVAAQNMLLMTSKNAAILIEIVKYPQKKALRIFGVGGSGNEALEELKVFARGVPQMAADLGCTRFEGCGRPGWSRALRELGMTPHVFMFKDIA